MTRKLSEPEVTRLVSELGQAVAYVAGRNGLAEPAFTVMISVGPGEMELMSNYCPHCVEGDLLAMAALLRQKREAEQAGKAEAGRGKSDPWIAGYEEARQRQGSGGGPQLAFVNPFREGTEQHAGFEAGFQTLTK